MTLQNFKSLEDYKNSFKGQSNKAPPKEPNTIEFNVIKTGGECRCKDKNYSTEIEVLILPMSYFEIIRIDEINKEILRLKNFINEKISNC